MVRIVLSMGSCSRLYMLAHVILSWNLSTLSKALPRQTAVWGLTHNNCCVQVEPYPKDFGQALGTALNFNFQEHMGMLKQLVGLTGALPVPGEDSPQTTLKRCASLCDTASSRS